MKENDSDIFDQTNINAESTDSEKFIPRFERDLKKMGGNLNALADAKRAEAEKQPDDHVPSIAESYDDYDESREKIIARGETVDDGGEYEEETPYHSQYHKKPVSEGSESISYRRGKTVEELMWEDEEKQRAEDINALKLAEERDYRELKDVNVSADMISDMGYNYKQQERKDKARQKELDDLAQEIGSGPKLEEMSDVYFDSAPLKKKSAFDSQEALGREEKELIKSRLQKEIDSRPKGVNKKNSAELYKHLMHEQKVKRAKRGLLSLLLMAVGGIASAFVIYKMLNPDNLNILDYVAAGEIVFSLIMLLKAKFFRTLCCFYFSAETVYMVYTCVTFALDTSRKPDNYFYTLVFFIVVIAVSAIVAIQLATNTNIESYYTTSFAKPKTASRKVNVSNKKR